MIVSRTKASLLAAAGLGGILAVGFFAGLQTPHSVDIDSPEAQPIVSALREAYPLRNRKRITSDFAGSLCTRHTDVLGNAIAIPGFELARPGNLESV